MAKKKYLKPIAEHIVFYTEEDITAKLPIDNWAQYESDANGGNAGMSVPSVGEGTEGPNHGWGDD